MSFADWVKNGGLIAHKLSRQEIANLLGIVGRDLKDSRADGVSDNWGFAIAYNAALRAATTALAAAGYGACRENHHYRVMRASLNGELFCRAALRLDGPIACHLALPPVDSE